MTSLRKYEHNIYDNSDFMSQDWEKINQKFVWLKVASINISCSTVPDCTPFSWCHFYLILNDIKVSLTRNGLLFKKVTFKIQNMNTIDFNKHDVDIFINDTWQKYTGNIGWLFKITRLLELRFWPTRNRSQPSQGNYFAL